MHLKGINTLDMGCCDQDTITDAAIANLKGIESLSIFNCPQLTSTIFTRLKGVKYLNLGYCTQLNFTDDFLSGIEWLNMYDHSQAQIDVAKSLGYPVDEKEVLGVWFACI